MALLLNIQVSAQVEVQDSTDSDRLIVKFAEKRITDLSGDQLQQMFYGDVKLYKDSLFMFCDTARIIGNDLWAKGNIIFIQNDTIRTFADSLYFNGDASLAYLYNDVILENGNKKLYTDILIYDTNTKIASYQDTALMVQETSSLQSIRGYYDVHHDQAFFYDDVYIEGEDLKMRADSMSFLTDERRAIFLGPTRIKQSQRDIYCESGFYDMDDEIALFEQNAQFFEPDVEATAHSIKYTKSTGEIRLEGNAYYRNKSDIGTGDLIRYNEITESAELVGNATFENDKSKVVGSRIDYNKKTEAFKVKGQSIISDPPYIISAESVDYDKTSNTAYADNNVVWQDTAAGVTIISDHLIYKKSEGYVKAINDTGKPLMRNISGGDTLYLSAEILTTHNEYISDTLGVVDTINYLVADNDVQILKSNLQAICDSLVYQDQDSFFLLLDDPVVWSDSSQIIGDTIEIYLTEDDIDHMEVFPKAFLTNSEDLIYFNQISGKRITAQFEAGLIATMDIIGNARSIYYMIDELKAYIGVNSTECSSIRFTFADNEIIDINFLTNPKSEILPMHGTNHEDLKLDGFVWRTKDRPSRLEDLNSNLTKSMKK